MKRPPIDEIREKLTGVPPDRKVLVGTMRNLMNYIEHLEGSRPDGTLYEMKVRLVDDGSGKLQVNIFDTPKRFGVAMEMLLQAIRILAETNIQFAKQNRLNRDNEVIDSGGLGPRTALDFLAQLKPGGQA